MAPTNTEPGGARQVVPVTPGVSYTLSGRYKVTGTPTTGTISARLVNPGSYAGPGRTVNLATAGTVVAETAPMTATAWTRFELTYVAPVTARFLDVQLVVEGEIGLIAHFDHLHFGPTHLGAFG